MYTLSKNARFSIKTWSKRTTSLVNDDTNSFILLCEKVVFLITNLDLGQCQQVDSHDQ